MKLQMQQRRAAAINDTLESLGLSARINVPMNNYTSYAYMKSIKTSREDFSINIKDPLRDIIAKAKEMEKPNWVKIETVCMDLIGKTVYVDKEIEVEIVTISGTEKGIHIITTNGRTFSVENLWIKE